VAHDPHGLPLSPRLRRVADRLTAEEIASTYRHDLTGKLGAARMLIHTLRKRLLDPGSPFSGDERAMQAFELADSAMKSALTMVERPLLPSVDGTNDPTDLAELATSVVAELAIARVTAAAPTPKWVDADADELAVALVALVENALEASDGPVLVRLTAAQSSLSVDVVDTGPGMPESAEETIALASNKPGRIGLGQRIVRRVARRWGGSFDVLREGDRTVARIELPLIRGDGSPEADFG
jgi:signal transduction histidine kinase